MFITNSKVFTTRDQNDLETLKKFAENLFEQFSELKRLEEPLSADDYFVEGESYAFYKVPQGMALDFLIENGAEYVALDEDDVLERAGKQYVTFKHHFSAEEQTHNADQLARNIIEKDELMDDLKEVKSSYKAKIDEKEASINKYSRFVSQGFEMRDEECKVLINYKDRVKQFISLRTGDVVKTEELGSEDYQYMISFPKVGTANV